MNIKQLRKELLAEGIPAMAGGDRIPLGPPYKTATGQWVVLADGSAEWCGHGEPTPAPDQAMLDTIASVRAAHISTPDPVAPDVRLVLRALVKVQRSVALSSEEADALDAMENWE
jgi:hypothetical protein